MFDIGGMFLNFIRPMPDPVRADTDASPRIEMKKKAAFLMPLLLYEYLAVRTAGWLSRGLSVRLGFACS